MLLSGIVILHNYAIYNQANVKNDFYMPKMDFYF